MKFIEFMIRQSRLLNLLVILIVVVGAYFFINGKKEAFPPFVINQVVITTLYPGASAETVEQLITYPVEKKIKNLSGVEKIESTSRENISIIAVTISSDYESRLNEVKNEIKNRIDELSLPGLAQTPRLLTFDENLIPVLRVLVTGGKDEFALRSVTDQFEAAVSAVNGVGQINREGYRKAEIKVECDPARMAARDISIDDVISALRAKNVNIPGGPVYRNGVEFLIRVKGEFLTLRDIENVVVRANDNFQAIRVGDVAMVRRDFEKAQTYQRANGVKGIELIVQKNRQGDNIRISDNVNKIIEQFRKKYSDIGFVLYNDTSIFIKDRLNVLSSNAFQGLILVVLILFIFFDLRTSFWTMVGIPISFCAAMIVASLMGISLNLMSMFGFIIVVGMIVDNSIVIAENIYQRREKGEELKSAVTRGTSEVIIPIIASVSTTIVAFMPLLLIEGVIGKFFAVIPIVVTLTLVASVLEAVLVLPGQIYNEKSGMVNTSFKTRLFHGIQNLYKKILSFFLRHKFLTLTGFLVFCILVMALTVPRIPFQFSPGRVSEYLVQLEMPPSYNLDQTERTVILLENYILSNKDLVQDVITTVGQTGSGRFNNPGGNRAALRIILKPSIPAGFDPIAYKDSLQVYARTLSNIVSLEVNTVQAGPPAGKALSLVVSGDSLSNILTAAENIRLYVSTLSNSADVRLDYEQGKNELVIDIDDARASSVRISTFDVANTVRNSFDGGISTAIKEEGEDVNVRVKYDAVSSATLKTVDYLKIPNRFGQNINFSAIGKVKILPSVSELRHVDARPVVTVIANLKNPADRVYTSRYLNSQVQKKYGRNPADFPGITIQYGGENEDVQKTLSNLGLAFLLAVVMIFAILIAIFKNYSQTIIILLTIPFGLVGVFIGLFVNNIALSYTSMIGIVALAGVVVNNGIIMIDFINTRIRDGLAMGEAILDGAAARIRSVLLTTLTTIVGLLPMAYGWGGSEELLQPLGITIVWGIAFATLLTLILVPILYSIFEGSLKPGAGRFINTVKDNLSLQLKKIFRKTKRT